MDLDEGCLFCAWSFDDGRTCSALEWITGRGRTLKFLHRWNVKIRNKFTIAAVRFSWFIRWIMVARHSDTFHRTCFISDRQRRFHRHQSNTWQSTDINRLKISLRRQQVDRRDSYLWLPVWQSSYPSSASVACKVVVHLWVLLPVDEDVDWDHNRGNRHDIDFLWTEW